MKLEVNTKAKGIEVVNCLLRIAIEELEVNAAARDQHGISISDINAAKSFQKAMVKAFLGPSIKPLRDSEPSTPIVTP